MLGWEAFALAGGFAEWQRKFGAEPLDAGVDVTATPALDRL